MSETDFYELGNYRRYSLIPEWQKKERRIYGLPSSNVPNTPYTPPTPSPTPSTPEPDNTMKTLQDVLTIYQAFKGKPSKTSLLPEPQLQVPPPTTSLNLGYNNQPTATPLLPQPNLGYKPDLTTPSGTQPLTAGTPSTEIPPGVNAPQMPQEQPKSGLWDYWKQPVFGGKDGKGGMPLDQFVTLAGILAHSIAPDTAGGRVGAGLAGMAGPIYQARMAQEIAPPKEPSIKEASGRLYGIGGTAEAPTATALTPEIPKTVTPHYVETIKDGMFGIQDTTTNTFSPVREATNIDMERIIAKEPTAEKPKMTGNVVKDKTSDTGWSYADDQGNIIAKGAPMPSAYKPSGGEGKEYKETVLMKFLTDNKLAKDYKEAWRMVKSLSGKSREDFQSEAWMKAYAATEDTSQADETMQRAGEVWDKAHGADETPGEGKSDIQTRFNADTSMKGKKLGKQTPKGYEVYEGNKLIGYYQ